MDGREATRLRIWQVDCTLLDAVLLLSFDPRELSNLARAAGLEPAACACPDARALVRAVHRACHEATPLALHLERLLDLVHRRALDALATYGLEAFGDDLAGRDLWQVPHLAGRLWAALTAPGDTAERLRAYLRNALAVDAMRALAARAHEQPAA
ncbi:MAG: hypothetical protein M9894_27805 [Planctomycetes bacterium]|nr:hypothetical protein [Planctomycetota bacterium]